MERHDSLGSLHHANLSCLIVNFKRRVGSVPCKMFRRDADHEPEPESVPGERLTTMQGHSECSHPMCKVAIKPLKSGWRRASVDIVLLQGKANAFTIRRATAPMAKVGVDRFTAMLLER
jgi:hypothetical protein